MDTIDKKILSLSKSKFRASFHLNQKMKEYVKDKGIVTIRKHACDFIEKRLKPAYIEKDGRQTPTKQVHPVFIAQHACACCCRSCLKKWYDIDKGRELTDREIEFIVEILIRWIKKEMQNETR